MEGTESVYGLMVNTVNKIAADYNTNGAYWAFYVNGECCSRGIEDGWAYQIVYTAGE